jgi:hypothetical protein
MAKYLAVKFGLFVKSGPYGLSDNFAAFIDAASTPSNLKIELGGTSNG